MKKRRIIPWLLFLIPLTISEGCATQGRNREDTRYFGAGRQSEWTGNYASQGEGLFPTEGAIRGQNDRQTFQGTVKLPLEHGRSLPESGGNFTHHSLDILPDRTNPGLPSTPYMLERFNSGSQNSGNFSHHKLDSLPTRTFPSTIDR